MNKLEILKKYKFFNKLEPGFRKDIIDQSLLLILESGKRVFKEGDICRQIALIGKGDIRVYKTGDTGREITLYHVRPGEICILAASSVLSNIPYPANAVVESQSKVLVIDSGYFQRCMDRSEEFRKFIFEILSSRLSIVLHVLEEIVFKKLDKRVALYLIDQSEAGDSNSSTIKKTHGQIAHDLGSAREVISRILKEFERIGAIEIKRGKINLTDKKLLQEYSE